MDALYLSGCALDFSSVIDDPQEAGSSRILNFVTIDNNQMVENTPTVQEPQEPPKRKRNTPGNYDLDAEVVALTSEMLLATNEYVCDICNKSFQREQNLVLHMKSHKYYVTLKKNTSRNDDIRKKVYVCPEERCRHHNRSKALGDLTGIKKHYQRKHGDKKFRCMKCAKAYGVQSDLTAHSKVCGTKDYVCDCGMHFNRRCLFYTHKALCNVLQRERSVSSMTHPHQDIQPALPGGIASSVVHAPLFPTEALYPPPPPLPPQGATEMIHHFTNAEAAMIGATPLGEMMGLTPFGSTMNQLQYVGGVSPSAALPHEYYYLGLEQNAEQLTRDFLGLSAGNNGGGGAVGASFGIGSSSNNNVDEFGGGVSLGGNTNMNMYFAGGGPFSSG